MRVSRPKPKVRCAPARSITHMGGPLVATLPATRSWHIGRAGLQRQRAAVAQAQQFARGRVGKHRVGVQKDQPVFTCRRLGQQGRRQRHGQQGVDAQHAHATRLPCGVRA
jgi:hypothetical protein